jgi:flagellar biosynthesis component FlhA
VGAITIICGYVTLLFPLSFLGGYFLTAYTESQNLRKVQKKKKITQKVKNDQYVPAMRATFDNVQKIEKLVEKLKYQISSSGLDRECKDLSKTVELFNTTWTESLFDYQDEPVYSDDDE